MSFGLGIGHLLPQILYFGAILAALISIFWRPHYGLYFLIPLVPMQTTRYRLFEFPLGNKLVDILLLSIFVGWLLRANGRLIPKTPLNKVLAALVVLFYAALVRGSFFLNRDLPLSTSDPRFSEWKNYMVMPLLFLAAVAVIKEIRQIKILVALMAVSTMLVNMSFLVSTRSRDLAHFSYDTRDAGVLGYAGVNGFAAFVAQFIVFLLALYAYEKRKTLKLALLAINGFSLYCLIYSFSRGAYLAVALSVLFLALFKERKLLIVLLMVVIGWQVFLPTAAKERIAMTYQEGVGLDNSARERVAIWEDAWALFSQHPVFGIGLETYEYLRRVQADSHGYFGDTHDYYLKILVETGLLGFGLFLWLLGAIYRQGWRLFRSAEDPFLKSLGLGFASMMVCAIVLNIFGDRWSYLQVDGYLWALLACVVRGQMITEEQRAEESAPALAPVCSFRANQVSPRPIS